MERELKAEELRVRRMEAERALRDAKKPWWRQPDPLLVGILAGALTLIGNIVSENLKSQHELEVERTKARYSLVLQAMATADRVAAVNNIDFFIQSGLLEDEDHKIRNAAAKLRPVLPAAGGASPVTEASTTALALAKSYGMSQELDGAGQTVGVIELGGGFDPKDLQQYAKEVGRPAPKVVEVSVLGAKGKPDPGADFQIAGDIEIIGSVAPAAVINVYFAPNSTAGMRAAFERAIQDHVSVVTLGWGQPEVNWTKLDVQALNQVLQKAAVSGVTVVVAAGDNGPTDGVADGRPHVDFPASSPFVLAVGGTSRAGLASGKTKETAWNGGPAVAGATFGSGWGTSEIFPRPAWQAATAPPDGRPGRAIPDVVAYADPSHGYRVRARGEVAVLGGTSLATPLWAAQIVQLNQALGARVGFLNSCLYQKIGPAGVLSPVSSGGETASSSPRWDPQTGWGAPDGRRLVDWMRQNWATACGDRR